MSFERDNGSKWALFPVKQPVKHFLYVNNTRQASYYSVVRYGHIMLKQAGYFLTAKYFLLVAFCAMIVLLVSKTGVFRIWSLRGKAF